MPILGHELTQFIYEGKGNTRSTNWAAERNMPILGLEPTYFISEGYWQHAFNCLGFRKKCNNIGTRTTQIIYEVY